MNTPIYLLLVATSRTRQRRSYRILQSDRTGSISDLTAAVCRDAGVQWNNTLGTYDAHEPYAFQDSQELQRRLEGRYKVEVL